MLTIKDEEITSICDMYKFDFMHVVSVLYRMRFIEKYCLILYVKNLKIEEGFEIENSELIENVYRKISNEERKRIIIVLFIFFLEQLLSKCDIYNDNEFFCDLEEIRTRFEYPELLRFISQFPVDLKSEEELGIWKATSPLRQIQEIVDRFYADPEFRKSELVLQFGEIENRWRD